MILNNIDSLEPRRHFAAGAIDPTFAAAGKLLASFSPPLVPAAVEVLPDGRTLIAARPTEQSDDGFRLLRLTAKGAIDNSFAPAIDFGAPAAVSAMRVLPDGKIVLAGDVRDGDGRRTAVARLNADGSADTTFGGDGTVTLAAPAGRNGGAVAIAIDPDGKLLLGADDAVIRLNDAGEPDRAFSDDGIAFVGSGLGGNFVQSLFADYRGRVWAAPQTSGRTAQILIARFNTDGRLDTTFSGDGRAYISGGNPIDPQIAPLRGDEALLVNIGGIGDAVTVRRIRNDGGVDSTFANAGVARIVVPGQRPLSPRLANTFDPRFSDLTRQQIVIAGNVGNNITDELDAFVIRLNADGSVDSKFGNAGVAIADAFHNDTADAVAVGPDGRITVASLSFAQNSVEDFDYRFAVTRIDGTDVAPAAHVTRTGTLWVQGSELDESIVVENVDAAPLVRVQINGFVTTFAAADIRRIAVRGGGGDDNIHLFTDVGASFELAGENGNDQIFGNDRPNLILGGAGNDRLFGAGGNDTLDGQRGDDLLEGGRGNDALFAGAGIDSLYGLAGDDTLVGNPSDDVLDAGQQ